MAGLPLILPGQPCLPLANGPWFRIWGSIAANWQFAGERHHSMAMILRLARITFPFTRSPPRVSGRASPDGNSQVSRLLTFLLLYYLDYAVGCYISLERMFQGGARRANMRCWTPARRLGVRGCWGCATSNLGSINPGGRCCFPAVSSRSVLAPSSWAWQQRRPGADRRSGAHPAVLDF